MGEDYRDYLKNRKYEAECNIIEYTRKRKLGDYAGNTIENLKKAWDEYYAVVQGLKDTEWMEKKKKRRKQK